MPPSSNKRNVFEMEFDFDQLNDELSSYLSSAPEPIYSICGFILHGCPYAWPLGMNKTKQMFISINATFCVENLFIHCRHVEM